jgi:hypothetical protein
VKSFGDTEKDVHPVVYNADFSTPCEVTRSLPWGVGVELWESRVIVIQANLAAIPTLLMHLHCPLQEESLPFDLLPGNIPPTASRSPRC